MAAGLAVALAMRGREKRKDVFWLQFEAERARMSAWLGWAPGVIVAVAAVVDDEFRDGEF